MRKFALAAFVAGSMLAGASAASAQTTIDFSAYPLYTPISSVDGVTISLYGGDATGTAETGSFGTASLGNSPTGDYPTSEGVLFSFAAPVDNVSFTFDNFGDNSGFASSFEKAFAGATLVDNQAISTGACTESFCTVTVNGSNITSLMVDNGGYFGDWEFGVQQLSFTPASSGAVPEPATWAMMLAGMGLIGFAMRRRAQTTIAYC